MKQELIMKKLKAIIADTADLDPAEISADASLMDDLDLSSMEVMTIVAELEDTYDLRIPEEKLFSFITVGDMAKYLAAKVK